MSKHVIIIYASTSGNTESVCEYVGNILKEKGFNVELHRAEQAKAEIFQKNKIYILATSTWEHGELNPFFMNLYKEMGEMDFLDFQSAFIGLGDMRYEPVLFCEGVEIVKEKFLEKGGRQIGQTLKINGEPYEILDTVVKDWTLKFIENISNE